jgi:hypothetical protein
LELGGRVSRRRGPLDQGEKNLTLWEATKAVFTLRHEEGSLYLRANPAPEAREDWVFVAAAISREQLEFESRPSPVSQPKTGET